MMRLSWLLYLILSVVGPARTAFPTAPRPNILFLFADDWGR
ncbi:MAG: hypothetical protein ACYC6N_02630 [Pirellulaceae bacterium]